MSDKERKIKAVETSPAPPRKTEGAVKVQYGYELPEDTVQRLKACIAQLEEALREAQPLVAFHIVSPGGMYNEGRRVLPIINAALSREPSEAPQGGSVRLKGDGSGAL